MTSSPAPISSAMSAMSNASVPEDNPMPCLQPEYFAQAASNAFTSGPRMKCCDSLTRSTAASSSALSARYWGLRSKSGTFTAPQFTSSEVRHTRRMRSLRLVVLEVPVHEPADARFDRRRRLVTDVTHQVLNVRERVRHIAGLQRQQVLHGFLAEAILEDFDVTAQLDGSVVADVVDAERRAAGRGIGLVAVPGRIGGRHAVAGADHALGD